MSNNNTTFDSTAFLANAGLGRTIVELKPKETFFCQGDAADSVFYLQKGCARVTVVSKNGKEATITLLAASDFVGEESLATIVGLHLATATADPSATIRLTPAARIASTISGTALSSTSSFFIECPASLRNSSGS